MKEYTRRAKLQIEDIYQFLRGLEKKCPVCYLAKKKGVYCSDKFLMPDNKCPMKQMCVQYSQIIINFKKELDTHSKNLTEFS